MSLSSALSYNMKPPAVASRSIRSSVNPINGTTFSSENNAVIRCDIPLGIMGQYLNTGQSYVKLKVRSSGVAALDQSVYSLFSKFEIYHNGVLLESINEFGALANALLDLQTNTVMRESDLNLMLGTNIDPSDPTDYHKGVQFATGGESDEKTFCFPIVSGIVGPQQDKYFPIGACTGDLRLEWTLNKYGIVCDAANSDGSFSIHDFELMLDIVELDASVARQIHAANGGEYKIAAESWRNFNSTIGANNTSASVLIPAKFSSLKNLLVLNRDQQWVTEKTQRSVSLRTGGTDFKSVQFRVGSNFVPQKPITDLTESYVETLKSMHNLGVGSSSVIDKADLQAMSYMQGIELESLSHRSGVLQSGINTTSILLYYEPVFSSPIPYSRRVDSYAHYDMLVHIDGAGQCSVMF